VTVYNTAFLLLYLVHDMIFFPPSTTRPKTTDSAAHLDPTAIYTGPDHGSQHLRAISRPDLPVNSSVFLRPTGTASSSRSKSYENNSPTRPSFDLRSSGKPEVTCANTEDSKMQSSPLGPHFIYPKKRSPELLEAINNNGLVIFLLVSMTNSWSVQPLMMRRQMS